MSFTEADLEGLEAAFANRASEVEDVGGEEQEDLPGGPGGSPASPSDTTESETHEGDEAGGAGEADPPQASPQEVEILGRKVQQEEAQALLDFYEWARQNPQHMAAFDAYLTGQASFVPVGQQQTPPAASPAATPPADDEDDLSDLPEGVRARLARVDEIEQRMASIFEAQRQDQLAQAQTAVQTGAEKFKAKHGLTDDEMSELQDAAAQLGVLPTIAARTHDMISAVEQTLDLAFWNSPKFRERAFASQQEQARQEQARQRKASALTGNGGSSPRTRPEPRTPADTREAMVAEIKAAMNGGSE